MTGENRKTRSKTCPSAILCVTNPTWTDLGGNPGFVGEKPATNHLSYGTASRNFDCDTPETQSVVTNRLIITPRHFLERWVTELSKILRSNTNIVEVVKK
jgi:hypothetical protein